MAESSVLRLQADHGARPVTAVRREPRHVVEPFDLAATAPAVHRFVARRIRNAADAADIAQQALLLALAKGSSRRGANASAWLFAIARNLIVDHYRVRGRFRFLEAAELADTEPALRTVPDVVYATCQQRERLRCWLDCVSRRLSLNEQLAVLLTDVYGYRDEESAAELGLPLPSFKLLLHRARTRLHAISGGSCALVGRASPAGADSPGGPAIRGGPSRCPRISTMLALRARLVRGLDLLPA